MNIIKTLLLFVIICLGIVGCNSQKDIGNQNTVTPEVNESTELYNQPETEGVGKTTNQDTKTERPTNEQPVNTEVEAMRTYVNQTDAWLVALPSTWNDVHIIETGRSTEFIFPSKNPDHNQMLFLVNAISEEEWKKLQSEGPIGTAKEITTTKDGDIYLYFTPLDMVLEGDELERFEELFADIPAIIESFSFE